MTLKSMVTEFVCENPECDEDTCQECCPHGDLDHGICMYCEKDLNDHLAGQREARSEGDR